MRYALLILVLLIAPPALLAQQGQRGVDVVNSVQGAPVGKTRAVVAGISKYSQLPKEKQLEFADKDAELFYSYLQKTEAVAEIELITNSDATAGKILLSIGNYLKKSESGDNLIIYFAGHGDVARDKTKDQDDAYLLCTNVSTNADYSISDAIGLSGLQMIIAEAVKRGVSVSLITDACRSGKVATSQEAAMSTAYIISQKWDKVMKLASCQENELSYESIKWGNGHGVFTYYLVKGLSREADDSPRDSLITLKELELYIKRLVSEATEDVQNPVKVGGDARRVFGRLLDADPTEQSSALPVLATVKASRSLSEPGEADEKFKSVYSRFKDYIRRGNIADSALNSYLDDVRPAFPLQQTELMKNELILSALLSAQRVLDKYLEGGNDMPSAAAFRKAAAEFGAAIELYGRRTALSRQWQLKKYFLEGFSYVVEQRYEKYPLAISLMKKAGKGNKKAAYVYHGIGRLYNDMEEYALSEKYLLKAIALAPRWTYPKSDLGNTYYDMRRWDDSYTQFKNALLIDSNLARIYNNMSRIFMEQGRLSLSERLYLRADSLVPNTAIYLANLGAVYLEQGRLKDAEAMFGRALQADSGFYWVHERLGDYYLDESTDYDKGAKALKYLSKARDLQPYYFGSYNKLGNYYKKYGGDTANASRAESLFRKAVQLNPHNREGYFNLAALQTDILKDTAAAEQTMKSMLRNNRRSAQAYYYRALFDWNKKDMEKSELNYRKSLRTNRYEKAAYYDLAELLEQTNRQAEAEQLLLQMEQIFKESPEDTHVIGNFYLRKGDVKKATEYFYKALKFDPSYSYAWSSLAYATLNFTGHVAEAKYAFLKARELNPFKHDPAEFARLIRVKAETSDPGSTPADTILGYWFAAGSLDPASAPLVNYGIAHLYFLNNLPDSAGRYLAAVGKPESADFRQNVRALEWKLLLQKGDLEKARKLIDEEDDESLYPSHLGKALYFFLLNDTAKAAEMLALEKEENPNLLQSDYLRQNYNSYFLEVISRLLNMK